VPSLPSTILKILITGVENNHRQGTLIALLILSLGINLNNAVEHTQVRSYSLTDFESGEDLGNTVEHINQSSLREDAAICNRLERIH